MPGMWVRKKCGGVEDARQVFGSMNTKDVVTWTTVIAGYAEQGLGQQALVLYGQMEQEGLILANHVIFVCLSKACASTCALQKGRQLQSLIFERGQLDNALVGTCLVDIYAKCGEARQVFDSMNTKDVVTENALISAYGTCDDGHRTLACFEEMLAAGILPEVAVTPHLVACSHEGLVHDGAVSTLIPWLNSMSSNLLVSICNCMTDLLGRAGHLDKAERMLLSSEDQNGLRSLLNACKSHGDVERAMRCFESIVRLEPQDAQAYVLMANTYADAGRWTDVDWIETQRRAAGASKKPAVVTVEVNQQVRDFWWEREDRILR